MFQVLKWAFKKGYGRVIFIDPRAPGYHRELPGDIEEQISWLQDPYSTHDVQTDVEQQVVSGRVCNMPFTYHYGVRCEEIADAAVADVQRVYLCGFGGDGVLLAFFAKLPRLEKVYWHRCKDSWTNVPDVVRSALPAKGVRVKAVNIPGSN